MQEVSPTLRKRLSLPQMASMIVDFLTRQFNFNLRQYMEVKMAKNWYPIINEDLCTSCSSCIDFCKNSVFENGDMYPKVVNPDNCVEFCRGCGKICPSEAITYFGDDDK